MDGMHDLGGRQGFGPIAVDEPEEGFHEAWEGRLYGMVQGMSRPSDWNIDWFRHCRELIDPVDYLVRPYYDQWLQSYAAMMVNSRLATVEELATGRSTGTPSGLPAPMTPEAVQTLKAKARRFDVDDGPSPSFAKGDAVRVKDRGTGGHTRLPAYARGRRGVIDDYHGAHIFPDAAAHGDERAEPLYTVVFDASEIWPDAPGRRDRIYIDLWESYLDRA